MNKHKHAHISVWVPNHRLLLAEEQNMSKIMVKYGPSQSRGNNTWRLATTHASAVLVTTPTRELNSFLPFKILHSVDNDSIIDITKIFLSSNNNNQNSASRKGGNLIYHASLKRENELDMIDEARMFHGLACYSGSQIMRPKVRHRRRNALYLQQSTRFTLNWR